MLLPVQTVGVMGDGRTYEFVCALRAVTSVDGMTADFFHFDMGFLGAAATRIINEVRGINRVVYDVTQQAAGDDRVGVGETAAIAEFRQANLRPSMSTPRSLFVGGRAPSNILINLKRTERWM